MNATFLVQAGHKVRLTLSWPTVMPEINTVIKDFCRMFHKQNLRRTMEVVPFHLVYENRKWAKVQLSKGLKIEEQIVMDLLSRGRLEIVKEEVIVLRDKVTKMSVATRTISKPERFDGSEFHGMWFELSRAVNFAFPSDEDFVDPNVIGEIKNG